MHLLKIKLHGVPKIMLPSNYPSVHYFRDTLYLSQQRKLVLRVVLVQDQKFAINFVCTILAVNKTVAFLNKVDALAGVAAKFFRVTIRQC